MFIVLFTFLVNIVNELFLLFHLAISYNACKFVPSESSHISILSKDFFYNSCCCPDCAVSFRMAKIIIDFL